jgi:DNA polymerase III alpha subunit
VVDEAIANTGWVASRCVPWLMDRSPKLPRYHDTVDESYRDLRRQVYAGLEQRGHADDQRYVDRVEMELAVYRERQVCDFFLIVGDLVRWMKSTDGLPAIDYDPHPAPSKQPQKVGLGRGSAGGCCVAYALGITLINPINYELRFERFLNPHREGLPDIDLDFTPAGADLAKEYLKRRYGPDKVYDLISHGTMAARGALSRVAMVYEIPHAQRVALTKKIPEDESNVKLETLREHIPELDRFAEDHPRVFEHAVRLQGSIGAQSEHAAGVVISGQPLDELMPVMKKSAKDDYLVTAFGETADKPTISKLGFLKLDLLVVVELAKQAYAEELVRRVHGVELRPRSPARARGPIRRRSGGAGHLRARSGPGHLPVGRQVQHGEPDQAPAAGARAPPRRLQRRRAPRRLGARRVLRGAAPRRALRLLGRRGGAGAARRPTACRSSRSRSWPSSSCSAATPRPRPTTCAGSCPRTTAPRRARRSATWSCIATASSPPRRPSAGRTMAGQIWDFCGHAAEYCFNRIHAEEYALMAVQGAHIKATTPTPSTPRC